MYDVSVVNTSVVLPDKIITGSVNIKNEKIVAIEKGEPYRSNVKKIINGKGMYLLPGVIDSHVHIRGGVFSNREDFESGTAAAAAGGVTTILEMPICNPPTSTNENFLNKIEEIDRLSYVDYCLYGGAGIDNLGEISKMAKAGAIGFKTFLMPPVKNREKEFYGLCSETEQNLIDVMEVIKDTGLSLSVHAELNDYIRDIEQRLKMEGKNKLLDFYQSRPKAAEIEAVKRVISCSNKTNCKSLICHISTTESIELIKEAQSEGGQIYGETCPQYLLFSDDFAAELGVFGRIKPPLRNKQNVDELMRKYRKGDFDATGSDHAPYLYEEKVKNGDSIWETVDGIPGIELSLRLLLNQVIENKINFIELSNALSTRTAIFYGIDEQKGSIEVGKDADLVLVKKLDKPNKVEIDSLFTKSRRTAKIYDGIDMYFEIVKTIIRGKEVFSESNLVGVPGYGKLIKPKV